MRPKDVRALVRRPPVVPIRIHQSEYAGLNVTPLEVALLTRPTIEVGVKEQLRSGSADRVGRLGRHHSVSIDNYDGREG